jgi:ACS family D-galactonate transporter-like MFS transporter
VTSIIQKPDDLPKANPGITRSGSRPGYRAMHRWQKGHAVTTSSVPLRHDGGSPRPATGARRLWDRQLAHYPDNGRRTFYLAITVLATVMLYYELYVQGAVATQIIRDFDFTFQQFIAVQVVGAAFGAFASIFAGLADRWGRANLVVWGLLLTALIILFGLPNASSPLSYGVLFTLLSIVEGIVLVATPALIRDFSPQVGRATAMGFWAMGPVLGSLLVTAISSRTLDDHPDWQFQFKVCGIVGLIVFVITALFMRELSPGLRDQLMVSLRDRQLIEARAVGLDTDKALRGHWRQMLRLDIFGAAIAVSLFLLLYFILVGLLTVYFGTVYGWSEAKANSLGNWYWIANAITLGIVGVLSDKLRVRKPFMVLGALIGLAGAIPFALAATDPQSYHTLAFYFVLSSAGTAMAYVCWMASFTETVERHNPAATATGLAIYGWTIRIALMIALAALVFVIPATSSLVNDGAPIKEMQAQDPTSFAIITTLKPETAAALQANPDNPDPAVLADALSTVAHVQGASDAEAQQVADVITNGQAGAAQAVDPETLAALQADPTDQAAGAAAVGQIVKALGVTPDQAVQLLTSLADPQVQKTLQATQGYGAALTASATAFTPEQLKNLQENGADVAQAAKDNPGQWRNWWWICVIGQLLFIPMVFLMAGRWSPRRAREDYAAHEAMVQREMEKLRTTEPV